jgi:hypothetical protein
MADLLRSDDRFVAVRLQTPLRVNGERDIFL